MSTKPGTTDAPDPEPEPDYWAINEEIEQRLAEAKELAEKSKQLLAKLEAL